MRKASSPQRQLRPSATAHVDREQGVQFLRHRATSPSGKETRNLHAADLYIPSNGRNILTEAGASMDLLAPGREVGNEL